MLDADEGMRPSFLGHILVEILLDASLIAHDASRLDRYYQAVAAVDPGLVESTVNRIAPQPAVRLAGFVSALCSREILVGLRRRWQTVLPLESGYAPRAAAGLARER